MICYSPIYEYNFTVRLTGFLPETHIYGLRMLRKYRERFSAPPRVKDPDMMHAGIAN